MIARAVGSKLVWNVAIVEMNVAQAKLRTGCHDFCFPAFSRQESPYLMPVVTATCPSKLNQPVIQDAKGAFY